jgi:alkylation response protein AidB-like acyl-CoA dehydrogenase
MKDAAMTDNARMIADSAIEFAKGSGGLVRARAVRDNWPHFDRDSWQQIAGLGWLGIIVPETHDGLGLGPHDMCVLLESVGRMLLPEPLAPAIAAAGLLAESGAAGAGQALSDLANGDQLWLMAPSSATPAFPVKLAHVADCYPGTRLIVASGHGATFEVRAIDTGAAGVAVRTDECVDGSLLSDIVIEQAAWNAAPAIAGGPAAQGAWAKACDTMLLGHSAYLVGLMDEALRMAIDYMKIRTQFGTPIGTFQALQHRAASCHVDIVASRALLYEACTAFNTEARARAACAAKARASAAALRVTKECIQFHGAIGFADEHDIGLYLRKAMTIAARQGGEMQQKLRYTGLSPVQ